MTNIIQGMETCMDCGFHSIIQDPDPDDWFCDDDVAVVCKLESKPEIPEAKYWADRQGFKCITVSCRPYNTRKETPVPAWCPKGFYKG